MRTRRPRPAQLRTRVVAGVLAVTLVALAGFAIAAITALRGYLLAETDSHLNSVLGLYRPTQITVGRGAPLPAHMAIHVQRVPAGKGPAAFTAPTPFRRGGSPGPMLPPRSWVVIGPRAVLPAGLSQYWVEWVSEHGPKTFLHGNPDLIPRLPPNLRTLAAGHRYWTAASLNGRAQLRVAAKVANRGTVLASTSLAAVNTTVDRLALIVGIGSAVVGLFIAVGVAWIMRRGLRPIETMAAQADRITAGDLTERVAPHDARTEVGRLGEALNGMLARIETFIAEREASQELSRRFFADASHELRTPLASLRANAELYQQGALSDRAELDAAMTRIALEAQRMSRLVDDMLRLARLDQHPWQQDERVDLSALVQGCAERAEIADPRRSWRTDIAPGLVAFGDEELLRRAIDNLLANVHAHTPDGTEVIIAAGRHGSSLTVEVSDDGPGVPADTLSRIFDRFYRASAPSHRPGSGLGLAIVKAIAAAHDGAAEAALNHPHGLRVTLSLPASAGSRPAVPSAATAVGGRTGMPVSAPAPT